MVSLLKGVEHSEDTRDSAECNVKASPMKRLPKEHYGSAPEMCPAPYGVGGWCRDESVEISKTGVVWRSCMRGVYRLPSKTVVESYPDFGMMKSHWGDKCEIKTQSFRRKICRSRDGERLQIFGVEEACGACSDVRACPHAC